MDELFRRLLSGQAPQLADLPTGTGKSDIAVIWLIALAYYGLDRKSCQPVPRRLVWVVNRKVLVGQIYWLAGKMQSLLQNSPESEISKGLRSLQPTSSDSPPLQVVQLRGQVIDDREWSFSPACPALVIGTVDQIGSRLLFQGYGLGKRERPFQAGLFGVDAWVCVDEAHLVPAFIMTLRQLREQINAPISSKSPALLQELFAKLPWYATELSATPGLPAPSVEQVLALDSKDKEHPVIAQRLHAIQGKRIERHVCGMDKLVEEIAARAIALKDQRLRVAIYASTPKLVKEIKETIRKGLGIKPADAGERILTITGRMRGVERDELAGNRVFIGLSTEHRSDNKETLGQPEHTLYLIGTSAAEVGVDTDADIVLCDMAPLATLTQRLGRLDRLGHVTESGQAAVMEVYGAAAGKKQIPTAKKIAAGLKSETFDPSAELLAAHHWHSVEGKNCDEVIAAATEEIIANSAMPAEWRTHELASATVAPLLCQPLTAPLLEFWTATTPKPSAQVPVHPWLYGLTNDDGTPLVGIIFRHELDDLTGRSRNTDADDTEGESDFEKRAKEVNAIYNKYSPCKSEAHFVPLYLVRQWLSGNLLESKQTNANYLKPDFIALRAEGEWTIAASDGEHAFTDIVNQIQAEHVIILPTVITLPKEISAELTSGDAEKDQTDVADRACKSSAPWMRLSDDKASIPEGYGQPKVFEAKFEVPSKGRLIETKKILRYFKKAQSQQATKMLLTDHQREARDQSQSSLTALTSSSSPWPIFFSKMGLVHDEGKAHPIWQNAIKNSGAEPLAKTDQHVSPHAFKGFRHEWGSLTADATKHAMEEAMANFPTEDHAFLGDLFRHILVAHHGYLRPGLPPQPNYEPSALAPELLEATRRWRNLQRTLGPWRLAYLEALLKAADTLASRRESSSTEQD